MFNMGGPIKQGVMHGIREPHKHGERVGANLVGDPIYPKDKTGRAHHAVFGGLGIGALAAASRFLPAAYRGWKGAKWLTPGKLGKWGRFKDMISPSTRFKNVTTPKGHPGSSFKYEPAPLSWKEVLKSPEKWGAAIGENPITAFTVGSSLPQAGYLGAKVAGAAPGALWSGAKRYADMVIPGDQSSWWKDKEPPTGVPLNPNLQATIAAVADTGGAKGGKGNKVFAAQEREKRVQKYLDMMGYDRSKKTAIADALIDASKIVSDRGTLDLKNINRELINPVIQATSKRLDKPEQIREAVGLMSTKAEIEKDLSAETDALAKTLTTKRIEALDRQLEEGVGIDLLTYIGSQKGKVKSDQLERVARLSANKHGVDFTKVTDADMAAVGENASEEEIIQSVVGDDGVYMIGDAIIQVSGGKPNRIV